MDMSFGKYQGKPVAWVVLKDPAYIYWMYTKKMNQRSEYEFAFRLIEKFDSMPFVNERCNGSCMGKNKVTRLSLYNGRYNLSYWFCDECDLRSAGALASLRGVSKISEVLSHPDCNQIVAVFAKAKGAPDRKTSSSLKSFFNY